jgi:hypothetical protein
MAETFAERKTVAILPTEKAPELASRVIKRGPAEVHGALDSLSAAATNREIGRHSESTHHSVAKAAHATRLAGNVQVHLREGTTPLNERFIKMLQSL